MGAGLCARWAGPGARPLAQAEGLIGECSQFVTVEAGSGVSRRKTRHFNLPLPLFFLSNWPYPCCWFWDMRLCLESHLAFLILPERGNCSKQRPSWRIRWRKWRGCDDTRTSYVGGTFRSSLKWILLKGKKVSPWFVLNEAEVGLKSFHRYMIFFVTIYNLHYVTGF